MSIRTHPTSEVAKEVFDSSERWLIEQLRSNRFPGRKIGRHWRMTDEDIENALGICANDARRVANGVERISGLTPTSRKRVVGL